MARLRWRKYEDYDHYRVSDDGQVKSDYSGEWKKIKPSDNTSGYPFVQLFKDGIAKNVPIHRMVATAFVDGRDDGLQVNHIDGNKHNNRFDNLEWISPSANTKHAYDNGLARWNGCVPDNSSVCPRRPIRVVETGDVYPNQHECAKAIGADVGNINACLKGRLRRHHGFHYEYADEVK